ncbi:putative reverse transcriptase zinc-binding domain-containing protein [Arabidopsis thaliana]
MENQISINGLHRYWNDNLISQRISPEDHNHLKSIHLSREGHQDNLIWYYTPSGEYTVKSGYWLLTHDLTYCQIKPAAPHGSVDLKNKIWKISIIPKIKYMLWRTISKALPTALRLITRGMNIDPICNRCQIEEESISHELFNCPYASIIWRLSNSPILTGHSFSPDVEAKIFFLIDSSSNNNLTKEQKIMPIWLIW